MLLASSTVTGLSGTASSGFVSGSLSSFTVGSVVVVTGAVSCVTVVTFGVIVLVPGISSIEVFSAFIVVCSGSTGSSPSRMMVTPSDVGFCEVVFCCSSLLVTVSVVVVFGVEEVVSITTVVVEVRVMLVASVVLPALTSVMVSLEVGGKVTGEVVVVLVVVVLVVEVLMVVVVVASVTFTGGSCPSVVAFKVTLVAVPSTITSPGLESSEVSLSSSVFFSVGGASISVSVFASISSSLMATKAPPAFLMIWSRFFLMVTSVVVDVVVDVVDVVVVLLGWMQVVVLMEYR